MAILVRCACGAPLQAPDEFAGKRAQCPYCNQPVLFPNLPSARPPIRSAAPPLPQFWPTTPGLPVSSARAALTEPPVISPPSAPATAPTTSKPTEVPDDNVLVIEDDAVPAEVIEFLDPPAPPAAPPAPVEKGPGGFERFVALLVDPRAIQWMLMLGGGLMVLGIVIWLVSAGIFENKLVVAIALGIASFAILGGGWYLKLKTDFQVAGRALAFLGCVVLPLNLWFYSYNDLLTLKTHLWLPALICTLVYIATVYMLRDPLFLYAVEGGVSLTLVLLFGQLTPEYEAAHLSLVFMALGLLSIHAERFFPADEGEFRREEYGLPLFWSGQAQIAGALLTLLASQVLHYFVALKTGHLDWAWQGNMLSDQTLLAGGLWLAGCYAYLYSDLFVRKVGWYAHVSAICFVAALVTLIGDNLSVEALIMVLAFSALGIGWASLLLVKEEEQAELARSFALLSQLMSGLPLLMGLALYVRGSWPGLVNTPWEYHPSWFFVAAMVIVSLSNRALAWLTRNNASNVTATYFYFSAFAVLMGATFMLRMPQFAFLDFIPPYDDKTGLGWLEQAPLLMLIPIAYLGAARLWRGQSPEEPLTRVAHSATLLILLKGLLVIGGVLRNSFALTQGSAENLALALVFAEATVFYGLAAIFRQRSANLYLAVAAGCGALWQLLVYSNAIEPYAYAMFYALLGVALLAVGRALGWEEVEVFDATGRAHKESQGRGVRAFQCGCAVLLVASLAAMLQGLGRLTLPADESQWFSLGAIIGTLVASLAAIVLAPAGGWRSTFTATAVGLFGVTLLTLFHRVELNGWQKFEVFLTVVGLLLVVAGYVGRFREEEGKQDDGVSLGLWLGSLTATLPLLFATLYYRTQTAAPSFYDEIALVTVTILLLLTGLAWQVKSSTTFGGGALLIYLVVLVCQLVYFPNVAIGVYLAIGGGLMFGVGVLLSMYRDNLQKLPEQIANREGVFRIIAWR